MNSKALGRFKFTLKNDPEFNWLIIIDVMYINNKLVLYVANKATVFQAARFLLNMIAKTT